MAWILLAAGRAPGSAGALTPTGEPHHERAAHDAGAEAPPQGPPPDEPGDVGAEPLRVGGEVQRPVAISRDRSAPEVLWGKYAWGVCVAERVISSRGQVDRVELPKPRNIAPEPERVIREPFESWRFEPATLDGKPVAVYYHLLIHHCPSFECRPDSG